MIEIHTRIPNNCFAGCYDWIVFCPLLIAWDIQNNNNKNSNNGKRATHNNQKKGKTKSYRNLDEESLHCRRFFVCFRCLDIFIEICWITDLIDLFASYTHFFPLFRMHNNISNNNNSNAISSISKSERITWSVFIWCTICVYIFACFVWKMVFFAQFFIIMCLLLRIWSVLHTLLYVYAAMRERERVRGKERKRILGEINRISNN